MTADTEREISPLKKAEDAVEIDTSSLSIEEVGAKILALALERVVKVELLCFCQSSC